MLKSVDHFWTREEVQQDKDHVYLFGDNIKDQKPDPKTGKIFYPSSTQAVIRGLPNAIGIPTKKDSGGGKDSYFYDNDADFELFKKGVDIAIEKAKKAKKPIKIAVAGIGTGAAAVRGAFQNGVGRFFDYLYTRLGELDTRRKK